MQPPLVFVLVVNWNGAEHLPECFGSLLAGHYANARFLLIDNASHDGSAALVRETFGSDPRVEVLECPRNLGWAGGNNAGIERALAANADYVFLLNNDTATAPDAIAELVRVAEADTGVGALAPKMLLYSDPDIINSVGLECSIIASSWDLGIGRLDGPRWNEPRPVAGACGGAAFYRAEALRKAGLLPTDFEIYLDDLDLCLRIWDAGYKVLSCPSAVVRHKFSATMGQGRQARRKYYLTTRNRLRVMLRNFPASRLPLALAAYKWGELRAIGRACLDGEFWKAGLHVRTWLDGLRYIPAAVASRRARRARRGAFWPLIRCDRMFYHGTEFPEAGWYAPRQFKGLEVRPMARRAYYQCEKGKLRVVYANCYPHLGMAAVEVWSQGKMAARLETLDKDEAILDMPGGQVSFIAGRVFDAEDTGEHIDIGGWLAVGPVPEAEERPPAR